MNNTWFRIAVSVLFCMASSVFAAPGQETDFVLVALEQLRDRMERDDKGTLDEFVADVSTASGLSAVASRDSLVSLLRDLKTHCKKSTALGEQLFALHGEHFSEREAKAYLVRVVDMAGGFLKKRRGRWVGTSDHQSGGQKQIAQVPSVGLYCDAAGSIRWVAGGGRAGRGGRCGKRPDWHL